jgi:hypothetical protein
VLLVVVPEVPDEFLDGPELRAGDTAVVAAAEPIQLDNVGDGPASAYVVIRAEFTATMQDGTAISTPPWAT